MDKCTLAQEQLSKISFLFFNSLGMLQKDAPPKSDTLGIEQTKQSAKEFAKEIIMASKQFEQMIDGLPGIHQTEEEQKNQIQELDSENRSQLQLLQQELQELNLLASHIRSAIHSMSNDTLLKQ